MSQEAALHVAISTVALELRRRDQLEDSRPSDIYLMVVQLLRRTAIGGRILDDMQERPSDPILQAAALQALGEAMSADPQAAQAIEAAVLTSLHTPPDSLRSTEEPTEAKRRRLLLESTEFGEHTPMPAASAFVQFFADFWPYPQRDIHKIEYIAVESEDPAAWTIPFADGSSLIVIQSRVMEWLLFQAQLAWLAGAGEDRTGCPPTKSGKLKLQVIFAALVRARRIHWRFGRFPGSLLVLMNGTHGHDPAMNQDFFMDSYLFILAHEIAHCVLGHGNEQRSLFGWSEPVAVTVRADPTEHEADRLAATILSQFAHDRADFLRHSPDAEYYSAWLGAVAAVAAISFWESGMFIRLSGSHPPAADRLGRMRASFGERWRFTRRLRMAGLDLLTAASGLNAVLDGATRQQPLPEEAWIFAIRMPCLTDDERLRLTVARRLDQIAWGNSSLEKIAESVSIPLPLSGANRAELAGYLSRIGITQERQQRLLDYGQPLMYSTAVDLISSASVFSPIESEAERRAIAYSIIMQNLGIFAGRGLS
jgi:hypothetical protein